MFLRQLFDSVIGIEAAVTIWFLPSKKSLHIPLDELGDLSVDDIVAVAPKGTLHYYFGLGLRAPGLPEHRQGRKADVVAITAVLSDIDLFDAEHPEAHEAQNLPASMDEAEPLILIPNRPDPNILISSGNGLYSGHFFDRPIFFHNTNHRTYFQKAYKAYQAVQIQAAKERGWQMDSTSTVQRVWRLPGPPNGKTGKPTEVFHFEGTTDPKHVGFDLPAEMFRPVPEKSMVSIVKPETLPAPTEMDSPDYDIMKVIATLEKAANKYTANIQLMLEGKPFAEPGNRDEALQGICATIAWLPQSRRMKAEDLAEILRPSLSVIAAEENAKRTLDEEMMKAVDKIRRSQVDWQEQEAERRPQLVGLARALGLDISEDDLDPEGDTSNDKIIQHSVIAKGNTAYIYDFQKEHYTKPILRVDMRVAARDAWRKAPPGISIKYMTEKGEKLKPVDTIMDQYGTVSSEIIGDLMLEKSFFDPSDGVFHEAMANFRVSESKYDKWIDRWLKLLAGEHYEKVCDWIAAVPQLEHQSCVLYLDGASGSGKGLLAQGLSRLWHKGGPTKLDNVLGQNFNAGIIRCPLLWIDEGAPFSRHEKASAKIRSLIGSSSFELNEKFVTTRTVNGCIRLLICANNDQVLCFGDEELGVNDLDAIVGRFLHVETHKEAAVWLRENNAGGRMTREWVAGDLLAQHCLWLKENRAIDPGKRFLVEGSATAMHRKIITQGDLNGLVFEWLVRFATTPTKIEKEYVSLGKACRARIGNGKIMVNAEAIADLWKLYMIDDNRPKSPRIGRVLSNLSHRIVKVGPRSKQIRFHEIDPGLILEWSRQNMIGDDDTIQENLEREIEQELEEPDNVISLNDRRKK